MSDSVFIRRATAFDADALARLRFQFRAEIGKPIESESDFVARTCPWMAERIGSLCWLAWVAEDAEGEVIGHVFAQLIEKIPNPVPEGESMAYITNAHVAPAHRNRGVGSRLIDQALRELNQREPRIDRYVLWPTEGSVALYSRFGFRAPERFMEKMNDGTHSALS